MSDAKMSLNSRRSSFTARAVGLGIGITTAAISAGAILWSTTGGMLNTPDKVVLAEHVMGMYDGMQDGGHLDRLAGDPRVEQIREERTPRATAVLKPIYNAAYYDGLEGKWSEDKLDAYLDLVEAPGNVMASWRTEQALRDFAGLSTEDARAYAAREGAASTISEIWGEADMRAFKAVALAQISTQDWKDFYEPSSGLETKEEMGRLTDLTENDRVDLMRAMSPSLNGSDAWVPPIDVTLSSSRRAMILAPVVLGIHDALVQRGEVFDPVVTARIEMIRADRQGRHGADALGMLYVEARHGAAAAGWTAQDVGRILSSVRISPQMLLGAEGSFEMPALSENSIGRSAAGVADMIRAEVGEAKADWFRTSVAGPAIPRVLEASASAKNPAAGRIEALRHAIAKDTGSVPTQAPAKESPIDTFARIAAFMAEKNGNAPTMMAKADAGEVVISQASLRAEIETEPGATEDSFDLVPHDGINHGVTSPDDPETPGF